MGETFGINFSELSSLAITLNIILIYTMAVHCDASPRPPVSKLVIALSIILHNINNTYINVGHTKYKLVLHRGEIESLLTSLHKLLHTIIILLAHRHNYIFVVLLFSPFVWRESCAPFL